MKIGWTLVALGVVVVLSPILNWALMSSFDREFFWRFLSDGSLPEYWPEFWSVYGGALVWDGAFILASGILFFIGIRRLRRYRR